MSSLYDSHCHLDFAVFDIDREQVLSNCKSLGIESLLIPGTQASTWQKQLALKQRYSQLQLGLGLHPYFLQHYQSQHLDLLEQMLVDNRNDIVALGEIGLDFHIQVDKELQQAVFESQLILANKLNLPVILHHRKSHNQLIRSLKQIQVNRGGVVHAFSGSVQEAKSYLDLGFKLGVGGTITYARAGKTRNTLAQLPLDSVLLETDSPDMPLSGFQGQRNSPEQIPTVLSCLADLMKVSREVLTQQCWQNYVKLFALRTSFQKSV